jgi:hypothetical protein
MTTARSTLGSAGTQTAGLAFGGTTGSPIALTQKNLIFHLSSRYPQRGRVVVNLGTARRLLAGVELKLQDLAFGGI